MPSDHIPEPSTASDPGEVTRTDVYRSATYTIFVDRHANARRPGEPHRVFVSFPMRDECFAPFGEVVFRKNRIDVVYVTTCDGSWFQYPDTAAAAAAVRQAVAGYDEVLTYGTSMGGYGALSFSRMVGATTVISCSPQYSIDPDKTPFELRYRKDVPVVMAYGGFKHDDLESDLSKTARVVLVFDPRDEFDKQHAKLVETHRTTQRLIVPFTGHKSLGALREMGLASELVRSVADGRLDVGAFRSEIRARRRSSPTYLRFLARRMHARKLKGVPTIIRWAAAVSRDDDWDGLRTDIRIAVEHGQYALAITQLRKLVLLSHYVRRPMFVTEIFRWGEILVREGFGAELRDLLVAALAALGPLPMLRLGLAKIRAQMGEADRARDLLNGLGDELRNPVIAVEVSQLQLQLGDAAASSKTLQSALDADPASLKLINLLSDQLFRQDRKEEALDLLLQASERLELPAHPHRHRLARLLEITGRNEAALRELDRILAERPADALAHRLRGTCLARLNRHDEACAAFRGALGDRAQVSHAAHGLGLSLIALGRPDEAKREVEQGLLVAPDWKPLQNLAHQLGVEKAGAVPGPP